MSLLGVYVVITYYSDASRNTKYEHKITNQRFDLKHIGEEIKRLQYYQSDALHWNIGQIEKRRNRWSKSIKRVFDHFTETEY